MILCSRHWKITEGNVNRPSAITKYICIKRFSVQSSVYFCIFFFCLLFIQTLALSYWALGKRFSREVKTRVVVVILHHWRRQPIMKKKKEEEEEHHRFGNKRWRLMIIFHTFTRLLLYMLTLAFKVKWWGKEKTLDKK